MAPVISRWDFRRVASPGPEQLPTDKERRRHHHHHRQPHSLSPTRSSSSLSLSSSLPLHTHTHVNLLLTHQSTCRRPLLLWHSFIWSVANRPNAANHYTYTHSCADTTRSHQDGAYAAVITAGISRERTEDYFPVGKQTADGALSLDPFESNEMKSGPSRPSSDQSPCWSVADCVP